MDGESNMSRLSSMKEILDIWNESLIIEHRGKSLCDGDPEEKRVCREKDEESR